MKNNIKQIFSAQNYGKQAIRLFFRNLNFKIIKKLGGLKTKKTYISVSLFAPPAGLEPATL
ncbi:hypothetical protein [Chryseobacterium sp.]|uniref:hypothetical protein n=1 Tax=Chryseobacterium sp. TaxID=1871047 RepID=UPI002637AC14|nr:hypothetical protein [Chryseobacterium sp.]